MRERILAVLLAVAAGAITRGAFLASPSTGWIVGGILLGLLGWLVVSE